MKIKELLQQSRKQAERAARLVRAAAQLRIARVETATDRTTGQITLEMALEEIKALPEPERTTLFDHARMFAAAVAPELLADIPEEPMGLRGHAGWLLGKTMLDHGHREAALEFVLQERPGAFPFLFAMNLLAVLEDGEQKAAVMRRAVAAWRETREREFVMLFRSHWGLLPDAEALAVLRAIVKGALDEPEWPMQGSFDEGRVMFTSGREYTLFEILNVLRRLDPARAEDLIAAHEQLAMGAGRYPNGWDSIQEEMEADRKRRELEGGAVRGGGGYIGSGAPRDMAYLFAMRDGDFNRAMEHALELYREDTDAEAPNFAPKVLWPSAGRFRSVLYHAGVRIGLDAEDLLTRIPDRDLQLLARIELAAALAGLPEMPNFSHRQSRPQHARLQGGMRRLPEAEGAPMVVDGAPVRCPGCKWTPRTGNVWGCRCGQIWNTFTSRGLCPACQYQWAVTQCMQCGKMSPHEDWYGAKEV